MEAGEFGAAYRDFSKALALLAGNCDSSFVYIQRGNASAAMGNLVEAEADHQQATRDNPSNKDRCQKERMDWYDKGCAARGKKTVASGG